MTEREALEAAREHALDALADLEKFPGGSYVADKAYDLLRLVLLALSEGLESLYNARPVIGGPASPGVWDGTCWDDTG